MAITKVEALIGRERSRGPGTRGLGVQGWEAEARCRIPERSEGTLTTTVLRGKGSNNARN